MEHRGGNAHSPSLVRGGRVCAVLVRCGVQRAAVAAPTAALVVAHCGVQRAAIAAPAAGRRLL